MMRSSHRQSSFSVRMFRRRLRAGWAWVVLALLCCALNTTVLLNRVVKNRSVLVEENPLEPNEALDDKNRLVHEKHIVHELPLEFDSGFRWEDLDLGTKASCGVDKCFWGSVSDSNVGYLITAEGNYDGLRKAFVLAERLERECGVRHLYAEPSKLVNVTTAQMQQLDRLTYNPSRSKVGQKSPYVYFVEDRCIAVQKVIRAPKEHLLYGTGGTKWEAMLSDMAGFHQKRSLPFSELKHNLLQERSKFKCALENEKMYWYDFQGLIDLEGNMFHIDLDAHFSKDETSSSREKRKIHKRLDDFDEFLDELEKSQPKLDG